ncbi:MAG: hypothetical protein JRJ57_10785 [Deltaproteobacteria bacterium]|nr:hypothetical protein [Deltaproteobacteria bacterium]
MRNEDILKVVDKRFNDYKTFFEEKFNDQKEFINLRITGMSGIMRDKFEQAQGQRDEIIRHQKVTNSRVTNLEKETRFVRWVAKNVVLTLLLTILLIIGIVVVVDKIGIETVLKLF